MVKSIPALAACQRLHVKTRVSSSRNLLSIALAARLTSEIAYPRFVACASSCIHFFSNSSEPEERSGYDVVNAPSNNEMIPPAQSCFPLTRCSWL